MKKLLLISLLMMVYMKCSLCFNMNLFLHNNIVKSQINKHTFTMRMLPLSRNKVRDILPRGITKDQWISYWGLSPMERIQKVLESLLISYGGAWLAWFTSFMAGSLVAACIGTALLFNWMYTPLLAARRRNLQIWPRKKGLYYALYSGRIKSLDRVRRRAGKLFN